MVLLLIVLPIFLYLFDRLRTFAVFRTDDPSFWYFLNLILFLVVGVRTVTRRLYFLEVTFVLFYHRKTVISDTFNFRSICLVPHPASENVWIFNLILSRDRVTFCDILKKILCKSDFRSLRYSKSSSAWHRYYFTDKVGWTHSIYLYIGFPKGRHL
jgi:hypothetical protein